MKTLGDYPNGLPRDYFDTVECCLCGGPTPTTERVHTGYGWAHAECHDEKRWNTR